MHRAHTMPDTFCTKTSAFHVHGDRLTINFLLRQNTWKWIVCLTSIKMIDFFFRFELSLPWPKIILLRTIKKLTIQNNISNLHLLDHQFSLPRCLPLVRNIILLKWLSPLIVFVCVCVRVNDEIWRIYIGRWDGWFFFLFFTFVVCKKRCCLRIFELRNSGCRCVFACMRVYGFYECNK